MNEVAGKSLLPVIRNTFMKCGAAVLVVAALTFASIYFHQQIVDASGGFRDFLLGPFADAVSLGVELLGKMHYSAYLVLFFAYVWISCVWWKLKSVSGIPRFLKTIHGMTVFLGVVTWFSLVVALKYQSSDIAYNLGILLLPLSAKLLLFDIYELYAAPKNSFKPTHFGFWFDLRARFGV